MFGFLNEIVRKKIGVPIDFFPLPTWSECFPRNESDVIVMSNIFL